MNNIIKDRFGNDYYVEITQEQIAYNNNLSIMLYNLKSDDLAGYLSAIIFNKDSYVYDYGYEQAQEKNRKGVLSRLLVLRTKDGENRNYENLGLGTNVLNLYEYVYAKHLNKQAIKKGFIDGQCYPLDSGKTVKQLEDFYRHKGYEMVDWNGYHNLFKVIDAKNTIEKNKNNFGNFEISRG